MLYGRPGSLKECQVEKAIHFLQGAICFSFWPGNWLTRSGASQCCYWMLPSCGPCFGGERMTYLELAWQDVTAPALEATQLLVLPSLHSSLLWGQSRASATLHTFCQEDFSIISTVQAKLCVMVKKGTDTLQIVLLLSHSASSCSGIEESWRYNR